MLPKIICNEFVYVNVIVFYELNMKDSIILLCASRHNDICNAVSTFCHHDYTLEARKLHF